MSRIILMAESGSDITPELAKRYGIEIVPMHVAFGGETRDDGTFPTTMMFEHYKKTRDLPRTSGSTPGDFGPFFERLNAEHPDDQILYLAYSACTTCSMQSGFIASEGMNNITIIDTKSVSAGQAAVVLHVARYLEANPDATLDQAVEQVNWAIAHVRMGFFPGDLDYLRAGGRVSNAAYLGAKILSMNPLIEIQDGKLLSTKKYRGTMERVVMRLAKEFPSEQCFDKERVYLIFSAGLDEDLKAKVEAEMRAQGFKHIDWVQTGCVISAHSGPGAFGIVGFSMDE